MDPLQVASVLGDYLCHDEAQVRRSIKATTDGVFFLYFAGENSYYMLGPRDTAPGDEWALSGLTTSGQAIYVRDGGPE